MYSFREGEYLKIKCNKLEKYYLLLVRSGVYQWVQSYFYDFFGVFSVGKIVLEVFVYLVGNNYEEFVLSQVESWVCGVCGFLVVFGMGDCVGVVSSQCGDVFVVQIVVGIGFGFFFFDLLLVIWKGLGRLVSRSFG